MTGYSYEPARAHDWLAVATAGRLLVAEVDENSDRVARLAATGDPTVSVQGVLEVLTAEGLSATGPFALLFWVDGDLTGQGLGVIVRGKATVIVDTNDGQVTVSSGGVTTWTEQVIESPTGFMVELNAPAPSGMPSLPLQQGAAWISRIRLDNYIKNGNDIASPASSPRHSVAGTEADAAPAAGSPVAPVPAGVRPAPTSQAQPQDAPAPATPAPATPAPATPAEETPAVETPGAPSAAAPSDAGPAGPAPLHEETRVFHTSTRGDLDGSVPAVSNTDEPDADGYDYLFGATVFRPIGAAAVLADDTEDDASSLPEPGFLTSPKASPDSPTGSLQPVLGDHDGRTVLASDIQAARQRSGSPARSTASAPPALRPPVHRYELHLPGNKTQPLSAPVILGRAPSVSNVPASVLPHLVTLAGDDISRSHVRVAVEGDTVVVTDLHSSNGTLVSAPGKPPQLLRAGEPTPVITGTTIDLGSDVLLRVAEIQE